MSSADLLRRAAGALRKAAEGVPPYFAQPWHPVITDSESLTGVRVCENHDPSGEDLTDEEKLSWACDACEHFETYSEGIAQYVATVHPPVGRLFAAWLTAVAMDEEDFGDSRTPAGARERSTALIIAAAVLREPEETRDA